MRTKIVQTDVACNQIRSWLNNGGYRFEDIRLNMDCYEVAVQMSSYRVKIMFDAQKQLYSFEMLNGKVKTSTMFRDLKDKFDTYYHINMVIVPNAKRVADSYENVLNIKTVFDNFVGHIKTGYTVKFKELGTDFTGLRVKEVSNDVYHVCYASYSQDGSYEVLSEAKYDVSQKECTMIEHDAKEDDNLYEESYAHQGDAQVKSADEFLASLANGDTAVFKDGALVYNNNGIALVFKQIDDHIILVRGNIGFKYITHAEVYGQNLEELCNNSAILVDWREIPILDELNRDIIKDGYLQLGDSQFPLGSFKEYMTVIDITDNDKVLGIRNTDSLKKFISMKCPPSKIAVVISRLFDKEADEPELVEVDSDDMSAIARVVEENTSAMGVTSVVDTITTVVDTSEEDSKSTIDSVVEQITTKTEQALPVPVGDGIETSVKLVLRDGAPVYVRFIHGEDLYNVPVDLAEKCGLDTASIVDTTEVVVKGGICMTEDERTYHKFARKVTDEQEIWTFIYNLFCD